MITVNRKNLIIPFDERVICRYGDNMKDQVVFAINEPNTEDCTYVLYILFPDERVNSVQLEPNGSSCMWNVKAEHIFQSGIAYIQIKAIGKNGEIWHSPKATVEFAHSLDSSPTSNFSPSVYQQLDDRINEVYEFADEFRSSLSEYTTEIISSLADSDYITRQQAIELINERIDELLLPLNKRLDGE